MYLSRKPQNMTLSNGHNPVGRSLIAYHVTTVVSAWCLLLRGCPFLKSILFTVYVAGISNKLAGHGLTHIQVCRVENRKIDRVC